MDRYLRTMVTAILLGLVFNGVMVSIANVPQGHQLKVMGGAMAFMAIILAVLFDLYDYNKVESQRVQDEERWTTHSNKVYAENLRLSFNYVLEYVDMEFDWDVDDEQASPFHAKPFDTTCAKPALRYIAEVLKDLPTESCATSQELKWYKIVEDGLQTLAKKNPELEWMKDHKGWADGLSYGYKLM